MVGVGTSTMPPALAAVQQHFGITPDVAGILLAVFTLPGLILTPLLGYLADRVGRQGVIVASLLVFAGAGAAAFLVERFEHLVVIRLVQGIGAASLGALNVTLISDFFDGTERVRLLGFNHSVLSVGTAILPVVSGWIAAVEWRLPFALPMLGALVAAAVLAWIPRTGAPVHSNSNQSSRAVLNWRTLSVLLVVSVITYGLLFGPFLNYLQEQIRVLDPAAPSLYQRIGLMVGLMSVATTVGALFVGRLSRRISLGVLVQVACALYGIALVLFQLAPSFLWLAVPTILFGLAQALNQPVVQSLVAALAPPERLGTVLSLNRTAALVGQTVGPLAFGVVYRAAGLAMVFWVGAALAAGCAFALRSTGTRTPHAA
jgi:MFS family permease